MCSEQGLAEDRVGTSDLERVREGDNEVSITKVLSAVYDEYRYNNTMLVALHIHIFLMFDCQCAQQVFTEEYCLASSARNKLFCLSLTL